MLTAIYGKYLWFLNNHHSLLCANGVKQILVFYRLPMFTSEWEVCAFLESNMPSQWLGQNSHTKHTDQSQKVFTGKQEKKKKPARREVWTVIKSCKPPKSCDSKVYSWVTDDVLCPSALCVWALKRFSDQEHISDKTISGVLIIVRDIFWPWW